MSIVKLDDMKNHWALITGASSGIGAQMCKQLARKGIHLVMVARRGDILEQMAHELSTTYNIRTLAVATDLSGNSGVSHVLDTLKKNAIRIRMLINNAADAHYGPFENFSPAQYEQVIKLNCLAVVSLSASLLDDLRSYPSSLLINVSSGAAYQPIPYMAVYAATKSFVHSFSQALYAEYHKDGLIVRSFVPDATNTGFVKRVGVDQLALFSKQKNVEETVQEFLTKIEEDHPLLVTAKGTRWQKLLYTFLPARLFLFELRKKFMPVF